MAATAGPDIVDNGLVLALDAADQNSFRGEATTNYYTTPETLTSGRTGTSSGGNYTDFTTGGPNNGRFTRWVRDTALSRNNDWDWEINYSNTGLSVGQTLNVSFYARCPNGTLSSIVLRNPDAQGGTFNLDTTWRRFNVNLTYGGDYTSTPFFRFNRGHSAAYVNGATYDLANIQIETKSYATTFTTGTRGTTVATGGGWADLTMTGNNGELINGVRESSDNLGSLSFDGTNDRVECAHNSTLNITSSITMESWIYPTAYKTTGGGGGMIITKLSYYMELAGSGVVRLYFYGLSSEGYHNGTVNVPLNTWSHIVGVRDQINNLVRIYVNGSLDREISSITGNISSNTTAVTIGSYSGSSYEYTGRIANTKIYNRALTATEVQKNFNETRSRFGI